MPSLNSITIILLSIFFATCSGCSLGNDKPRKIYTIFSMAHFHKIIIYLNNEPVHVCEKLPNSCQGIPVLDGLIKGENKIKFETERAPQSVINQIAENWNFDLVITEKNPEKWESIIQIVNGSPFTTNRDVVYSWITSKDKEVSKDFSITSSFGLRPNLEDYPDIENITEQDKEDIYNYLLMLEKSLIQKDLANTGIDKAELNVFSNFIGFKGKFTKTVFNSDHYEVFIDRKENIKYVAGKKTILAYTTNKYLFYAGHNRSVPLENYKMAYSMNSDKLFFVRTNSGLKPLWPKLDK